MSSELEESEDADDGKELEDVGVLDVGNMLLQEQIRVETAQEREMVTISNGQTRIWPRLDSVRSFESF